MVRDAYKYEKNNLLKTTLLVKSDEIIGFISLCTGTTKLTKQYRKGHKIFYAGIDEYPTVNVTHFAIDNRYQHTAMHYGHVIFNDTLKRIANGVVSVVGVTLIMVVEALEEARPFYEKGFSFQVHDSRNTNGKVNLAITIPELKIVVNG
ncbi:MAG: hypothetical protein LKJ43_02860 [Lentilactobacillus buchneri]|uniref:hypothetical protein n=1 Tax=Lentilactobacillus parabuchneri TaxID=152331 RepID=UPI00230742BA|nr:hypothetical protein [Lentilactobacillus parabuchneri]MCI1950652.1 hypothetical protein [Lentilactobacillus buchneri]MCI2018272.1 hypothetical protein [Lentilactobacillus buchneri]MCI2027778.1 hypothetical protein [Lentilactobacillus buchneri]MDB1102803.1 hypothetical protein [Lentilactobacillus parabuchneri]